MKDLKNFGKVAGLFAWGLLAIGASAAALNSHEGYYVVCGLFNLGINAYQIGKSAKR